MDAPAERRTPPTIFDILRARVRAASDGQLVVATSLGVIGLVALGILRRWPWAGVALCGVLLGAGIWGILDRSGGSTSVGGRKVPLPVVSALRVAAGLVGLISLLVLLLGTFGLCLGTWIS
ncbi:MAG TPA: hypothetical protein VFT57_14900 [Gemmatimonadaceae bacterium]|jgi:hypothetical protein|nr:hypothetical protein [Gemmatimonadaceae bacterium]